MAAKRKKRAQGSKARMGRLLFILCLTVSLLGAVFLRVIYIKNVHGEEYQQRAQQQQIESTDVTIPALRGSIVDRNGNVLAESARVYNVILDCQVLIEAKESLQISTIELLMSTLKLEKEETIRQYMTEAYKEYRYLKLDEGKGISVAQMEELQKGIDDGKIVGVWFEEDENRQYINNSLAAHVIGFNGTYGVEQYYDEYLKGVEGRKMVVAGNGSSFVEEYIAAENGKNLTLTIDSKVQYYMEQILQQGVVSTNALKGCAICMNPKTGEIYGMVIMPTFNLNNNVELFGLSDKYKEKNPDKKAADYYSAVWTNYAISSTYEPGSTFKPMFASAALNEAVIGVQDTIVCGGRYDVYDAEVQCAGREAHGTETVADIIRNSCNVGMTKISEMLKTSKWLQYQEAYGFAQKTGIDLVGEAGDSLDLIYISEEQAAARGSTNDMGPFEKATTAFGQGFRMTPIQLITAFSSVINGGEYLKPYVVSQVSGDNGNIVEMQSKEVLRYTVSEEVSKAMRQYMYGTVSAGTGIAAQVAGYEIGGKTGTAEKINDDGTYEEDKYVVSFIGFTPVEDPEVVLLVILDETDRNTSAEAANLASQMFEKILPALGLYPDASVNQHVPSPNANNSGIDIGASEPTSAQDSDSSQDSADPEDSDDPNSEEGTGGEAE